jgi:hypothetical protein
MLFCPLEFYNTLSFPAGTYFLYFLAPSEVLLEALVFIDAWDCISFLSQSSAIFSTALGFSYGSSDTPQSSSSTSNFFLSGQPTWINTYDSNVHVLHSGERHDRDWIYTFYTFFYLGIGISQGDSRTANRAWHELDQMGTSLSSQLNSLLTYKLAIMKSVLKFTDSHSEMHKK